ncbi:MAG TPA: succinate dehydrogenase cytochrome b subunit [Flavitalea sp.]|nr:succinate dehydrogenase cytochrome b subunit [Flavitalea sp.]
MKWSVFFTSSVGKKLVMALTGLFLISFLVVHVSLNACIWVGDDGSTFNRAAHFMASSLLIRTMEYVLFAGILLHVIQGYLLESKNLSRRGKGYRIIVGNKASKWYSRTMGLLGTLLLLFLIMHIYHFWTPSRLGGIGNIQPLAETTIDGKVYHNLYGEMLKVFQNPVIVILYVLGCISLAYHLIHGFQSAFRTLGLHNHRYLSLLTGFGKAFSVIISLAFAMMPVSIYFGWVH